MAALIFAKNSGDKCLILDTRQSLSIPFTSPDWTDLRLGMWLSLTTNVASNADASPETIYYAVIGDKFAIGFKDSSTNPPTTSGTVFAGYLLGNPAIGGTYPVLNSTPSPGNGWWTSIATMIYSNGPPAGAWFGASPYGSTLLQFPTNANATGYCAFHAIKLTRPTTTSLRFTCRASTAAFAGTSGVYTSNPTITSTRNLIRTFPDAPSQQSPYTSGYGPAVPDIPCYAAPTAIYFHWPFYNSRLRIHAIVLEKYA